MKTYNCTCVIGGGGYVTLYGSLFLVQVHAQGLTRVFSMNFDRVLERAFRHSLLYTKVSYIVPDKINPWIITGVCIRKFALLIHISGAETERRLHLSVQWFIYSGPLQECGPSYVCCFWTAVKYGDVYYRTNVFIV